MQGEGSEEAAVRIAHTHDGLVDIQSRHRQASVAEALHHVVVGLHRIEVLGSRHIGRERRDAVGQTFLHEVVTEVHEVLLTHCDGDVERPCPVALRDHLEHHEVVLVERVLTLEGDDHTARDRIGSHHHATLAHGVLVDGDEDGVGRDDVEVGVLGPYPVFEDVLQLERVVAKLSLGLLRVLLVELQDLLLERRLHLDILVCPRAVVESRPGDRHGGRVVSRTFHLVDVPVGLEVGEVADAGVGAHAFCLLVVPEREGIVVTIGEDDRVALVLQRHEVVASEVAAGISSGAVVVVPGLRHHLYRHQKAEHADDGGECHAVHPHTLAKEVVEGCDTHAAPDSEGVERAGISIVALTRLYRCLVQIDDDRQTCHEEQEEDDPELTDAAAAAERLPEESNKSEDKRQTVEHVVSFVAGGVLHGIVSLQILRQLRLVTEPGVVDERDARDPVAMLELAVALDIILTASEVPHEVTPVHEVALVREEEPEVLNLCRHLHRHLLPAAVVRHLRAIYTTHPRLIVLGMAGVVHTREDHVLRVDILVFVCDNEVRVFLVLRSFLFPAVDGRA